MNRFQFSGSGGTTPVVLNVLIINVLFFIASFLLAQKGLDLSNIFGAFYFDSPNFHWWQIITYMFMHGGNTGNGFDLGVGLPHIFFNMFALYMFGPILENIWGSKRFLYFYVLTGVGALLMQWAVQALEVHSITGSFVLADTLSSVTLDPAGIEKIKEIYGAGLVGASGAIFGLLIAFGMLFPNAELFLFFIPIPIKAKYLVPVYVLIELVSGVAQVQGDSVAHFAHIGGALFGFIIIKIWNRGRPSRVV